MPPPVSTTVSTKGQVILPKPIRDQLRWEPGTRLSIERTTDGILLKPLVTIFAPTRPDEVFASLPTTGAPKSIQDMHAGIAAEARRRHARARH